MKLCHINRSSPFLDTVISAKKWHRHTYISESGHWWVTEWQLYRITDAVILSKHKTYSLNYYHVAVVYFTGKW